MGLVPFVNDTNEFKHIGAVTVPPGETRMVDRSLLHDFKPAAAPEGDKQLGGDENTDPPAGDDKLVELLTKAIPDIQSAFADLTDEDLDALEKAESAQDGKNRVTLLQAISTEKLSRAANK